MTDIQEDMKKYDFSESEKKWTEKWQAEKIYEPDFVSPRGKGKFYNLMMFPYPSAEGLHVGNMYAFTGSDIYGRFKRMRGYDVFEPIGLDGFGIHSENYAMKIGTHPKTQAEVSEKRFYEQLKIVGNGFAWDERLETYKPEYYKWTQWLFTEMWRQGLVYRKKQPVNWCPSCKTVLSDEQAENGKCERCGSVVEKKDLEQWFFRITKYADRLLKNLDVIDWSERVKIAQRNWIGKSEGALIKFQITNDKSQINSKSQFSELGIEVFTTRPDTLFGATYLVISPEHDAISNPPAGRAGFKFQISNKEEVERYIADAKKKTEEERIENKEKTGIELKGVKAINPANNEEIPIFVADYVLSEYGTGAIMAVPAHDERDWEFAEKFGIPIRQVILPVFGEKKKEEEYRRTVLGVVRRKSDGKFLMLRWKKELGWVSPPIGGIEEGEDILKAAEREVFEETGFKTRAVKKIGFEIESHFYADHKKVWRGRIDQAVLLELEDESESAVSPEEKALHEVLWMTKEEALREITHEYNKIAIRAITEGNESYIGEGVLVNSGKFNRLSTEEAKKKITEFVGGEMHTQFRLRDWLISRQRYWGPPIPMIYCDACAKNGKGEQTEMPGWYAVPEENLPVALPQVEDFRPRGTGESPLASDESFYKTICPSCGGDARRETDVSDTFLDSAWYYLGFLMKTSNFEFKISNLKFADIVKRWLPVDMYIGGAEHSVLHLLYVRFVAMALKDAGLLSFEEPFPKFRAHGLVIKDGAKMSKSKGNVINPDEYVKEFGADAFRMYLMFLAPFEQGGDFQDQGILGTSRFLDRVEKFCNREKWSNAIDEGNERILHKTIKKVTDDIENLQYNTAISALMILLNEYETKENITKEEAADFLKLLAPFAPFLTEEIWSRFFDNKKSRILDEQDESGQIPKKFSSIHHESWPEYDEKKLIEDSYIIVVQTNGKVRDQFEVSRTATRDEIEAMAISCERVVNIMDGRSPKKIIYVPGRLVNIVF